MSLPKLSIFVVLVLASLFLGKSALAQVLPPIVPCNQTRDPEFHSLRPYQASPCEKEIKETVLACGNDLIAMDKFKVSPAQAISCSANADRTTTCQFSVQNRVNISVSLSDAELPILGNTQLVKNSSNPTNKIDEAERVNEYVSWYLNGVANRAEEGETEAQVDFSGPLNKLLPLAIQHKQRIESIESAKKERHNQIAVCGESSLGIIGDIFNIGTLRPKECYKGDGSGAEGLGTEVLRLEDWEGNLSIWNSYIDQIIGRIVSLLPSIPENIIRDSVLKHWNSRKPPLPWEDDPFEKRPMTNLEYRKYYNEWRGKTCVIVPVLNLLFCFDNFLVPNKYADLFPYVPFSSTEDRVGDAFADLSQTSQPSVNDINVTDVKYQPDFNSKDNLLYFAHMLETNETAGLLQKTYLPKGESGYSGFKNPDALYDTKRCDLTNVRWNSGDDLFGESDSTPISGTLSYKAAFSCTFGPLDNSCEKEVPVALSIYNRTPKGDELWDRLVAGDMAIFKRIYPAEFFTLPREILDLPGVTSAKYTSTADKTLAGDPTKQKPGDKAEFYIPHLGGIQEYFLKGIQKALRPKGFGDQIPPNPPPTGTGQCSPLAYDIDYRNTSILPKPKEEVINLIKSRFPGNQVAKYYDTVVSQSILAGYSPAFTMAIWIEETGASDYGQFGTNIYDFGCGAAPKGNFSAQLDCFLGLYDYWSVGSPDNSLFSSCREGKDYPNFEDFMLYFAEGICTTIERQNRQFCGSHSNFPTKFQGFYNIVVAP